MALSFTMTPVQAKEQFDNGVLLLDPDTFEQAIDKNDYLLVMFYAPWCNASKMLGP